MGIFIVHGVGGPVSASPNVHGTFARRPEHLTRFENRRPRSGVAHLRWEGSVLSDEGHRRYHAESLKLHNLGRSFNPKISAVLSRFASERNVCGLSWKEKFRPQRHKNASGQKAWHQTTKRPGALQLRRTCDRTMIRHATSGT